MLTSAEFMMAYQHRTMSIFIDLMKKLKLILILSQVQVA